MTKEKIRKKVLETYLSGRKNPGAKINVWEEKRQELPEETKLDFDALTAITSTKELRIRGRKKGIVTPRQTFRCDEALWRKFKKRCRSKENKSASEILRRFIYKYTHR